MAQRLGKIHADLDALSVDADPAIAGASRIHDLLNPENVGGEKGNDHPAGAFGHKVGEPVADLPVGDGEPFLFHVGRIRQQGQNALPAAAGETVDVGPHAEHPGVADLEITGVDDPPHRGLDRKPHPVDHAVADPDKLQLEGAQAKLLAGADLVEPGRGQKVLLFEPVPNHAEGKGGAEHRGVDDPQQVGKRPDMIFVSVRQDDAADFFAV